MTNFSVDILLETSNSPSYKTHKQQRHGHHSASLHRGDISKLMCSHIIFIFNLELIVYNNG